MEIINHLGNILSKKINLSPPAARGLIKLSIKDELGPFKPLIEINLDDLKSVIKNSLNKRLIQLEVQDSDNLILFMIDELILNQSLITMSLV